MSNLDDLALLETAWSHFRQRKTWYSSTVVSAVSWLSRFVMTRMNDLRVDGLSQLQATRERSGRGLLTFSNHVSMFDDPWLICCFGLPEYEEIRWVAADAKNFFSSRLKGAFFSAGKCVPVVRGLGLDQPGFAFLEARLREGDWVHLFPEGGRTRNEDGRMKMPFKPGIGRLIDAAEPVVLPFFHTGMGKVLPLGKSWPRRGNAVDVRFGEPVLMDRERISAITDGSSDERERMRRLTRWTEGALQALELPA
jgi:monolysocardiolipin acyltransferase